MPPLIIADLSGGRNGVDSPVSPLFPDNQCVEALNVDFRNGGLGRKRSGSSDVVADTTGHGFTRTLDTLIRHVPSGDETLGEVWGFEDGAAHMIARLPAGTVWSQPSVAETIQTRVQDVNGVSFNGKLFLAYDSANDRLKVYDPRSDTIRVVGLATPAQPTVSDTAVGGAYPAVARFYRVRYLQLDGTTVIRVSEAGAGVVYTPTGANTGVIIGRPAAINEGETHWRVEASTDNVNYYIMATQVVATANITDTALVATYSSGELTELTGTYTLPSSAKYVITDNNRLILAGNWEITQSSRVSWMPVLGSLNRGDDERLFQTANYRPYLDLNHKNGGEITGISQIAGVIYVFKFRQVWRLTPTGDDNYPYSARRLSGTVGAVSHKSIALGEDELGNPYLYFVSHKGPYRVGAAGVQYVGRDIEDVTRTSDGAPNINTVATTVVAHSTFHSDLGQWWVWMSTGNANSPADLMVLDVKQAIRRDKFGVRGGWSKFNGDIASAVCSCQGNKSLAATGSLRPWAGISGAVVIALCDRDDKVADYSHSFQAYVKTKSISDPMKFGTLVQAQESLVIFNLIAHGSPGATSLSQTLDRDFGRETSTTTVNLLSTETGRRIRKFEGATMGDATVLQVQLGDSAATASGWQIDEWKANVQYGGEA